MFSNSTEGDMFTARWCSACAYAFEGDQLCDEAASVLFDLPAPDFLVRVTPSRYDPTGVICRRFARRAA